MHVGSNQPRLFHSWVGTRLCNTGGSIGLPKTTSSDSPSKNLKGLIHAGTAVVVVIQTALEIEKNSAI